jgi:hypothetical protein
VDDGLDEEAAVDELAHRRAGDQRLKFVERLLVAPTRGG